MVGNRIIRSFRRRFRLVAVMAMMPLAALNGYASGCMCTDPSCPSSHVSQSGSCCGCSCCTEGCCGGSHCCCCQSTTEDKPTSSDGQPAAGETQCHCIPGFESIAAVNSDSKAQSLDLQPVALSSIPLLDLTDALKPSIGRHAPDARDTGPPTDLVVELRRLVI